MAFQRILSKMIVALALMFAGAAAHAQIIMQPTIQPQPYQTNVWFDPAFGGSGWTIAWLRVPSIPSGRLGSFGFYTYDATGRPTWLSFQQPYEATPVNQIVQGNPIGRMSGDFLEFRGGPTPTGPATPAASSPSPFGPATLRWISSTMIEASYGGVTRRLIPGEFAVGLTSVASILEGRWSGQVRTRSGDAGQCSFRLVGRSNPPGQRWVADNTFGEVRELPQAGSVWLEAVDGTGNQACYASVWAEVRPATGEVRFWALTLGALLPDLSGYRIGTRGFVVAFVEREDRVVAWDAHNTPGSGDVFIEFEFTKLR